MDRIPPWAWLTAGVLVVLGVLLFFQTRDPMILIFGVMGAGTLLVVLAVIGLLRTGVDAISRPGIRVKCGSCGALNLEDAKFCSQCARSI